jgi:L-ribulose-5-phosphate 4-epimerase
MMNKNAIAKFANIWHLCYNHVNARVVNAMSIEELKKEVWRANLELAERGLVIYTWGNVSAIDRERGLVVIKPSGVDYGKLQPEHMVMLTLDGKQVEEGLRPSSDTPTHLALYRAFEGIGGITHTHSTWATVWAQGGRGIPCYGTTHADYFYGEIPCTRPMEPEEIRESYEAGMGRVIVERFDDIEPLVMPAVLVYQHGPFTWGRNAAMAVENSAVLEQVARMAHAAELCNPHIKPIQRELLDKHFLRKHGTNAYYGQKN